MIDQKQAIDSISRLPATYDQALMQGRLAPAHHNLPTRVPCSTRVSLANVADHWQRLPNCEQSREALLDARDVQREANSTTRYGRHGRPGWVLRALGGVG